MPAYHTIPHASEHLQNQAIQHATFIRTNPLQVYLALTTPHRLDAWFITGASVLAVRDGQINFRWVNWESGHISTEDGGPLLQAIP